MALRKIELQPVTLPDFGLPRTMPEVTPSEYKERVTTACARAAKLGFDFLVIYADREHFANLMFLTGYDPRFEEALLVLPVDDKKPTLVVGNEGLGYSELATVELERKLYQGFSLMGQKRDTSPRLERVLAEAGIKRGHRIGLVGYKYVTQQESDDPEHWFDVPAFIVDALCDIVGDRRLVTNATALFMNPEDGLRLENSVDQLAVFEFAASHCSQAVRNLIENLRPGVTELEVARALNLDGLPLSVHPMFSTGPRARLGLPSPTSRRIDLGDPFTVAVGLRGGLTARAGFVVQSTSQLPENGRDYLERLAKPYFSAIVAWYEHLAIGVCAGELQAAVEESLAGHNIGIALNPGHYIHLEEWVHSPVYPGSTIRLRSGMLLQCDIIPVVEPHYHTTNAEDTIALADASLRASLAAAYPELWQRILARRALMRDTLGIDLKPEVLPFSNLPALLQPFALRPDLVMVAAA